MRVGHWILTFEFFQKQSVSSLKSLVCSFLKSLPSFWSFWMVGGCRHFLANRKDNSTISWCMPWFHEIFQNFQSLFWFFDANTQTPTRRSSDFCWEGNGNTFSCCEHWFGYWPAGKAESKGAQQSKLRFAFADQGDPRVYKKVE